MREINETIYVHLNQQRDILFPLPLSTAGIIRTPDVCDHHFYRGGELEFCLRLASEEEEAEDELNGELYRHRFPHLLIKRGGVSHRYSIKASRQAIFLIYPAELEAAFIACGMAVSPPGIEFEITSELEGLLEEFFALIPHSQNRGMAEKFDVLSFRIIQSIYMQKFVPDGPDDDTGAIIRRIASYLQLHYMDEIDIDALCRRYGMSRRGFFRNWAVHYSCTPHQYIMDLRMREAERLLGIIGLQVQEVSACLGFKNHSYFIQVFRRYHHGVTPGEFRRDCHCFPPAPRES
ncbi:MAG: helix-turn-helix transcriptional regulator [Victivallales bacterium]|nr:helix-turn-helix transcriptional regulator [Victivallales bacterium]